MGDVYNHREGYCLVLSGGGAKGVYHIGVWKALKELGIGGRCLYRQFHRGYSRWVYGPEPG